MSNVIPTEAIMNQLESRGAKFIIIGALVDLTMQNGWVKKDEFVPIDSNDAVDGMDRLACCGEGALEFVSRLFDANNDARRIIIACHVEDWSNGKPRSDIKVPNIVSSSAHVEGSGLTCSNVRLVTHLSIGYQVIGENYANGDLLRKNVNHAFVGDIYR